MPKKIIIIVDDEENILKLLEDILRPEGYKVLKAQSGADALKILSKTKPDLILLDHFMPLMTGRDLCEKIRADNRLKDLKVIFLTVARFSKAGIENLKFMNVLDYIQKPFDQRDLINRVKKVIG